MKYIILSFAALFLLLACSNADVKLLYKQTKEEFNVYIKNVQPFLFTKNDLKSKIYIHDVEGRMLFRPYIGCDLFKKIEQRILSKGQNFDILYDYCLKGEFDPSINLFGDIFISFLTEIDSDMSDSDNLDKKNVNYCLFLEWPYATKKNKRIFRNEWILGDNRNRFLEDFNYLESSDAILKRSVFYSPSNGLKSAGFIYADIQGNSSF